MKRLALLLFVACGPPCGDDIELIGPGAWTMTSPAVWWGPDSDQLILSADRKTATETIMLGGQVWTLSYDVDDDQVLTN
jgi:hypothetical protein